jgi:cardiolipin synthase A/B
VVADDAVYIGSANFDMRSLFVNLEVMLRVEDAGFAAQLRALVDAMEAESEVISREWLRAQGGWLTRLRWFLSWFVVSTIDYTVVRRLNFGLEVDPEAPGLAMEAPEPG